MGIKMSHYEIRTDLALEARETIHEDAEELRGVFVEEYYKKEIDVRVTKVVIETKNGAKSMGKPIGTYITLEAPGMVEQDEDYHKEISEELADHLEEVIPDQGLEITEML